MDSESSELREESEKAVQSDSSDGFQVFGGTAGNEEKPGAACGAQAHAAAGRPGHERDEASQVSDRMATQ